MRQSYKRWKLNIYYLMYDFKFISEFYKPTWYIFWLWRMYHPPYSKCVVTSPKNPLLQLLLQTLPCNTVQTLNSVKAGHVCIGPIHYFLWHVPRIWWIFLVLLDWLYPLPHQSEIMTFTCTFANWDENISKILFINTMKLFCFLRTTMCNFFQVSRTFF